LISRQLCDNSSCNKDSQIRIGEANSVFGRFKPVWKNEHISLEQNVRLYESLVLSKMLCSAKLASVCHTEEKVGSSTSLISATDTRHLLESQSPKRGSQGEDSSAEIKILLSRREHTSRGCMMMDFRNKSWIGRRTLQSEGWEDRERTGLTQ